MDQQLEIVSAKKYGGDDSYYMTNFCTDPNTGDIFANSSGGRIYVFRLFRDGSYKMVQSLGCAASQVEGSYASCFDPVSNSIIELTRYNIIVYRRKEDLRFEEFQVIWFGEGESYDNLFFCSKSKYLFLFGSRSDSIQSFKLQEDGSYSREQSFNCRDGFVFNSICVCEKSGTLFVLERNQDSRICDFSIRVWEESNGAYQEKLPFEVKEDFKGYPCSMIFIENSSILAVSFPSKSSYQRDIVMWKFNPDNKEFDLFQVIVLEMEKVRYFGLQLSYLPKNEVLIGKIGYSSELYLWRKDGNGRYRQVRSITVNRISIGDEMLVNRKTGSLQFSDHSDYIETLAIAHHNVN